jgi:hypothetical protein
MRNVPVQILSAANTASITGSPVFVGQVAAASFIPVLGDVTAAGTIQIQGSNAIPVGSPETYIPPASSFANIPSATSTITAGIGSAIVIPACNFQYVQAVFTHTSGGSTTIVVNASFFSV